MEKKKLTHQDKINYMDTGMSICHICMKKEHLDLVIRIYETILEKGDKTDLKDIAKCQAENIEAYPREPEN